jgi:hypothetical protein
MSTDSKAVAMERLRRALAATIETVLLSRLSVISTHVGSANASHEVLDIMQSLTVVSQALEKRDASALSSLSSENYRKSMSFGTYVGEGARFSPRSLPTTLAKGLDGDNIGHFKELSKSLVEQIEKSLKVCGALLYFVHIFDIRFAGYL